MASSSSSFLSPLAHKIIKSRWIGFLIWQLIVSTPVYFLSPPYYTAFSSASVLSFLLFSLSLLLFSFSLYLVSSPHTHPSSSFSLLFKSAMKSAIGGFSSTQDEIFMLKRTLLFAGFFMGSFLSGMIAGMSRDWRMELGFASSVMFCCDFIWNRRWVLVFPTVQRPLFYSFKRGIPACIKHAFKLSSLAFLCSLLLSMFLPNQYSSMGGIALFIVQLIYSYIASLSILLCWELSHHLLQVVHTRRCSFAPPQGSAAAEANPSELLLEALEQSTPRSLLQYLAYLDLCMVSESNVEPWRRAAFFEESGETYRRIVSVCLRPLEQLTSKIGDGLEGSCADKSDLLAQQVNSAAPSCVDMKIHEAFIDLQICIWCARTLASLTARSHREDRYGVAQLTNCNVAVVSTLLSSLLAVEACLGKKTSLQPTQILGPSSINWVTSNTVRRDGSTTAAPSKKRGGIIYANAYIMADVLRTSIYQIVCTFQSDMQASLKASVLEKNWIMDGKPLYSTREILVQKLLLFLDFRAN